MTATPTPSPAAQPSPERVAAVQAIAKPQTDDPADDEYSYGFRLWEAKFYPEAQQQLRLFLDKYPEHWRTSYARNLLGRAYLEADFFAEALGEFTACEERRGEASAVFLDDTPSVRYLSTLPYWTGRAQAGLSMRSAANQEFGKFLALRPEGGPLADDARQRLQ